LSSANAIAATSAASISILPHYKGLQYNRKLKQNIFWVSGHFVGWFRWHKKSSKRGLLFKTMYLKIYEKIKFDTW